MALHVRMFPEVLTVILEFLERNLSGAMNEVF
jgi:hypothetical protein